MSQSSQNRPPETPSKEASAKQLELAKRQGEAYAAALDAMDQASGVQTRRASDVERGGGGRGG